ncbi:hypothetical protein EV694_0568 [Volucribacter psittacicida]|uniref:Uncharacterized protein n=1 Tax=Volucribacter psittacicida TaxID=203482 RepID=A0A4R1G1F9_9PAST|nr:hypothetical protein EV694_0568 [Volucribacter psittacicida]
MITYQQLCEKHNDFQKELFERQLQLQREIKRFVITLENDLGLTDKTCQIEFNSRKRNILICKRSDLI